MRLAKAIDEALTPDVIEKASALGDSISIENGAKRCAEVIASIRGET